MLARVEKVNFDAHRVYTLQRVRPEALALVMDADHFCMHWRGIKDTDSAMVSSVMRGAFLKDANLRREFLSLLPRKNT